MFCCYVLFCCCGVLRVCAVCCALCAVRCVLVLCCAVLCAPCWTGRGRAVYRHCSPEPLPVLSMEPAPAAAKCTFQVEGMTCASCVDAIENYVRSTPGVISVSYGRAE